MTLVAGVTPFKAKISEDKRPPDWWIRVFQSGRPIGGFACFNPAKGTHVRLFCVFVCCVGSCFCDELITRSECVRACVRVYVCEQYRNLNNMAPRSDFG